MKFTKHAANALLCLMLMLLTACSIKIQMTGTNINYDILKTIQIDKIANRAPYGWAPMEAMFNNKLQDLYATQTRLKLVKRGGDLQVAGEIVSYDQFNKAVSSDGFSSQVQLRMTVNIRFTNTKSGQKWEKQFSATTQYDSTQQLTAVQESLVTEMVKDLCDQIFNATVADW
ncbi:MAG: LptE family protein [Bacteroidales bacterium]|nr:LPS assembly lipoprotein LptE [Bacteroidales bacterium]MDD6584106.1 LptE family protein [Bacteroidales bacterium]MDD6922223.1 LptE family protein [Bacteroidales bacterium]MEE0903751.1 LptE family protein [Prevotellamassilia sp.]